MQGMLHIFSVYVYMSLCICMCIICVNVCMYKSVPYAVQDADLVFVVRGTLHVLQQSVGEATKEVSTVTLYVLNS